MNGNKSLTNGNEMLKTMNAIIVDDEIEACNNLSHLLKHNLGNQINILAIANSTKDAELRIQEFRPDVVFLDIEMPNENAFQFLTRIGKIDFEIIFVTAYDEYAIRAFKLNAVGYILKPIDIDDLLKAIEFLKERLIFNEIMQKRSREGMIDTLKKITEKQPNSQLILNDSSHWESVAFMNITHIQASGSYSKIYYINKSGATSRTLSKAISEYENLLPTDIFFRVHKSYLINCSYIQKVLKGESKEIQLTDGTIIPVGRRRYTEFLEFIKKLQINE